MPEMAITLFGLGRSVYTRIARLALEEKGVAYQLEEVEIFGSAGVPAEHLARHPFGRIPVLQHGAFMLYETAAITRYIDEAFAGPPLQPAASTARARMNQIIGILDAYAFRAMVWGVFVERVRAPATGRLADNGKIARALLAATTCLAALGRIADGDDFLVAGRLTLADLHAYPMLRYLELAPEGSSLLEEQAPLQAWYRAMQRRASVAHTRSLFELDT